jgi:hypothetical protein
LMADVVLVAEHSPGLGAEEGAFGPPPGGLRVTPPDHGLDVVLEQNATVHGRDVQRGNYEVAYDAVEVLFGD